MLNLRRENSLRRGQIDAGNSLRKGGQTLLCIVVGFSRRSVIGVRNGLRASIFLLTVSHVS